MSREKKNPLLSKLEYHVTGAIERGESEAIVAVTKRSSFTPGPWKMGMNANDEVAIWTSSPSTNIVAKIYSVPHENNTDANAALIAAAPEMYAALEEITRVLMSGQKLNDSWLANTLDILGKVRGE